jgi:hypothetical protein
MKTALVIVACIAIIILIYIWEFKRSGEILQQWADENDFEIIHREYRTTFRGPFSWTTTKSQTVYFVQVCDRNGRERSGWVRCGSWFWGLSSNTAEVRWEDE